MHTLLLVNVNVHTKP